MLRTARALHAAFVGTTLVASELRWPSLATRSLVGATTVEVVARGKHLLHRFDTGMTLHSHRRMEGRWEVRVPSTPPRHHHLRAVLTAPERQALGWQLGMLDLVPTDAEHTLVGHLGPDVLGHDWDPGEAAARLRREPGRPIGEALLDQRNLAGLGTMWVSDLLFLAGILPWRAVTDVCEADLSGLLTRARSALHRSAAGPVPTSTGQTGRGSTTWTHGRSGRPCRRCGHLLRVGLAGTAPRQRTLFYCPRCQGGIAPGDDGRPQAPLGARPRGAVQRGPARRPGTRGGYG